MESGGLALEDSSGKMKLVSATSLARLFKSFKNEVECVVLNACYSEVQAEAIHQHIDYVVGMSRAIGDRAAIEFAKGFYDALGAGRSFDVAFEIGCTSIDLESIPESLTPVLKSRQKVTVVADDRSIPTLGSLSEEFPCETAMLVLEDPEGQVPLKSAFYVDRPPNEQDCYETILKPGALIRVKAPRQMGKTSLMSRILHQAMEEGYQTACISFQSADARCLTDLDVFLRWFCASITNELGLPNKLNDYWQDEFLGSKDQCTNYFQRYLLTELKSPIALGLDEVDEVFKRSEVAIDFFGLLRAWHERAKNNLVWQKLRLIITHSKEVYIPLNINQSPFNVGLPIELPVWTDDQVRDLLQRHGLMWPRAMVEQLMNLLGGHPYLVRVALYQIARDRMTLEQLEQVAATEEGPYGDHLRRHWLNLEEDDKLLAAAKQVFSVDSLVDVGATQAFKLRSMGIVKLQGNDVMPLCEVYCRYFRNRMGINI
jgi:hypothetical protein